MAESGARTGGFDGRAHVRLVMDLEVVEDDHVAGSQRRHEHLHPSLRYRVATSLLKPLAAFFPVRGCASTSSLGSCGCLAPFFRQLGAGRNTAVDAGARAADRHIRGCVHRADIARRIGLGDARGRRSRHDVARPAHPLVELTVDLPRRSGLAG